MADISTWSPVDASNNQPPPDGWPEGQAPSSVNNCGRAMMGAVRRFYDQTINGTLSLPYLPLTGGTVTGSFYAPNVVVSGGYWMKIAGVDHVFADYTGSDFVINDTSGQPSITITPTGTYYRNGSHTFQDEAGVTLAAISAGGTFSAIAGVNTTNVVASGTVQAGQLTSTANASVTGTLSAGQLSTSGNFTAVGTVQGQQLTSTGNITAAGQVNTVSLLASGTITGNPINSNGNLGVAGSGNIAGDLGVAGTVFAHAFVDTDGLFSVFDTLRDLQARVEALEGAAHAR
jgi:cytoskeletal protein CcmA (bactofilin family)